MCVKFAWKGGRPIMIGSNVNYNLARSTIAVGELSLMVSKRIGNG